MKIGAAILAAGSSQRFGTPKQLLLIDDRPMLQHVVDLVLVAGFDQIVLVLGANRREIEANLKLNSRITLIDNSEWSKGQSTSVRLGVEALEGNCDAIMFFLGDQPFVTQDLVKTEIAAFNEKQPEILVPVFNHKRGNPVIFNRICFQDLKGIHGDQGGRAIFAKHSVYELVWMNYDENKDIDTVDDYGGHMEKYKNAHSHISTIILAAGLSTRMKKPKLVLPWGDRSVLGAVITAYQDARVGEIIVVTGGSKDLVEKEALKYHARAVFNPDFENGEMADSLKVGLRAIVREDVKAVFVALADHPEISSYDIEEMMDLYERQKAKLIIPSSEMRRGHPWLIDRTLWPDVLRITPPRTMREFIEDNKAEIAYYLVEKSKILEDLDTPEDYERLRPK